MIGDVDATVRAWLGRYLPADVRVVLDPPDRLSARDPSGPAVVDAFLRDVREEPEGVASNWTDVRDERGRVVGRQPVPRRYRFGYLLTAWAPDPEREHDLLGRIMVGAAMTETVPTADLRGSLVAARRPVVARCAPHEPPHPLAPDWPVAGERTRLALVVFATFVPDLVTDLAPAPERLHLHAGGHRSPPGAASPARPAARITEG